MIRHIIKIFIYRFFLVLTGKLDFRHYWIISRNIPIPDFYKDPGQQGNLCYGNINAVRRAMGDDFDEMCMIEHGVYFGRYVIENECTSPNIKTIYTYSPYREEVLHEHFGQEFEKRIVQIGPYVKYAKNMLSNKQMKRIKDKWGRVLLVFPSHSSPEGTLSFDYNTWISEIDLRAKDFDTVVINLFWLDIYNGYYKKYLNKGFVIACCGNRFDSHFLSRQKDLIAIADMTMSNDVGTHIGYCVSLNKPHYLFHQQTSFAFNKECDESGDKTMRYRKIEYEQLYNAFSSFSTSISENQLKLVHYYWGDF